MASSAAKVSVFLLLTLLSTLQTHARDSQFFNKIPTTTNNVVVPNNKESPNNQQQQQEPNFLPENENSYGLYGHESGQNPPSTTTTTVPENTELTQSEHKYLPKNYNPVAYVTQPENVEDNTPFTQQTSFTTTTTNNNNNNNNGEQNYNNNNNNNNNNQQEEEEGEAEEAEFRSYPTTANNYLYNGGSSFNSQPQGQINGENYGFQPQGMSDTRKVANGKYFYDINTERYSTNHPYESLRAQSEFNSRNFYQNNAADEFNNFNTRNFYGDNANDFNAEGYQSRQDFQDEENMP